MSFIEGGYRGETADIIQANFYCKITKLQPYEQQLLAEKIHSDNGICIALIHPNYGEGNTDVLTRSYQKIQQNLQNQYRLLASTDYAVFLFEEPTGIFSSQLRFNQNIKGKKICIVPTQIGEPTPRLLSPFHSEQMRWDKLIGIITKLGVKKFFLGGRNYWFKQGKEWGCVPAAKRYLSKGFDVDYVPDICFPDMPRQ